MRAAIRGQYVLVQEKPLPYRIDRAGEEVQEAVQVKSGHGCKAMLLRSVLQSAWLMLLVTVDVRKLCLPHTGTGVDCPLAMHA